MKKHPGLWLIAALIGLVGIALPAMAADLSVFDCSWTGYYYASTDFTGTPITRLDPVITFDWGGGDPIPGLPADNFTIRWIKDEYFGDATYTFAAAADDGIRMYVDGDLIIDDWVSGQMEFNIVEKAMTAGVHEIKVEYYEGSGRAAVQAGYYPSGSCDNCGASYACTDPSSDATATTDSSSSGDDDDDDGSSSSSSSSDPSKTATPLPTITPTPQSDIYAQAEQELPGHQDDGMILDQDDLKSFSWVGFPGPSVHSNGYDGSHSYVKNRANRPSFSAQWVFQLLESGYYDVLVYIPQGNSPTTSAYYTVFHGGQLTDPIEVDQDKNEDQWVELGTFYFQAGELQYIALDNVTGERTATTEVLLDAVMLVYSP